MNKSYAISLIALLLCLLQTSYAADNGDKPAPVDDPIGLGERLALIDYLRDEKKQKLPNNPSLKDLRRMYWKLEGAAADKEASAKRERIKRLRHQLEVKYAIVIPEETDYAGLQKIKEKHQQLAQEELKKLTQASEQKQSADDKQTHKTNIKSHAAINKSVVLVATKTGSGSGFFINHKGYLITNRHVVGDDSVGSYATIYWDAGQKRDPENFSIIAISKDRDLALLKPMKGGKTYTYFKTDNSYQLTKDVIAAGYPLGASIGRSLGTNDVDLTLTKGSISSVRKKDSKPYFLQTDASSSQGCSGGPLIDSQSHKVLGIITKAIDPKDNGASGSIMTFAIPSTEIKAQFRKHLP